MARSNVFAGPYLDRAAHRRQDADWFSLALGDPASRVVPVWNSRSFVTQEAGPRASFLALADIPADKRGIGDLILLGTIGGVSYFAYDVDAVDAPTLVAGSHFEDLRVVASLLPADEAGLLGYARALVSWRRANRFCGRCGATTRATKAGHVLVCMNSACRHEIFPRLDPAIIVLVSRGPQALLGRQASWPHGRYSTIAGFVEPGESLEDAVAREVLEETGIVVEDIAYHSSQPWPFPASLMLGFTAHAVSENILRRDDELEDARWFSRADIEAGTPLLPPRQSISFRLIEHWFDSTGEHRLEELQGATPWPTSR